MTTAQNGTFDLADKSWAYQVRYSSQPLELLERQMSRGERKGVDVVVSGSRRYLSWPGAPVG